MCLEELRPAVPVFELEAGAIEEEDLSDYDQEEDPEAKWDPADPDAYPSEDVSADQLLASEGGLPFANPRLESQVAVNAGRLRYVHPGAPLEHKSGLDTLTGEAGRRATLASGVRWPWPNTPEGGLPQVVIPGWTPSTGYRLRTVLVRAVTEATPLLDDPPHSDDEDIDAPPSAQESLELYRTRLTQEVLERHNANGNAGTRAERKEDAAVDSSLLDAHAARHREIEDLERQIRDLTTEEHAAGARVQEMIGSRGSPSHQAEYRALMSALRAARGIRIERLFLLRAGCSTTPHYSARTPDLDSELSRRRAAWTNAVLSSSRRAEVAADAAEWDRLSAALGL